MGNSDILLHKESQIEPELRKELYKSIYDDSEWLIDLVENLLFLSRIDHGVMSIRTATEVLQEIIPETLNSLMKRTEGHSVSLEMPDELLVVKIDARLITQLIINIVDNAVKYTPAGSDIVIKAFRRDTFAVIEIADTGPGIAHEDKDKVFEMFYIANKTSGDSRRGIGLGLSLCKSIVDAHGGMIQIFDNIPRGAVVSFTLELEEDYLEREYIGD
jgi:two-component system sensor histidine kinase KdpD